MRIIHLHDLIEQILSGVLAGAAASQESRAIAAKTRAVDAAGELATVEAAWAEYSAGRAAARGLRVGGAVLGVVSGASLGLTVGFALRGAKLRATVAPWDPWAAQTTTSTTGP